MTVRVVHHLELVQIEIEQRQHPAAGTGSRQPLLELGDKSSPIGEPGERVLPGAALVLAFGAHGGDQHPVQPEAGHRHGGQIHRDLEEEDKHEWLPSDQGARNRRPQAQHDHRAAEPRRTEVAEADTADHRTSGHAGERRRHPVAGRQADQRPVADAAAPGDRQDKAPRV